MKYEVGYVMRLGSEDNIRRNGLRQTNLDGTTRTPSIGHKGSQGANPNFSDFANHDATCVDIKDGRVYMKCTCGSEWNFAEKTEPINDLPENYGLLL